MNLTLTGGQGAASHKNLFFIEYGWWCFCSFRSGEQQQKHH